MNRQNVSVGTLNACHVGNICPEPAPAGFVAMNPAFWLLFLRPQAFL